MKINIEFDKEALALMKKSDAEMSKVVDAYALKHQVEIDAESHLVDSGIIDESVEHFLKRAWLEKARNRPALLDPPKNIPSGERP